MQNRNKYVMEISPLNGLQGNCFYSVIPTVAGYLDRDYYLLSSNSWGFTYHGFDGTIAENLFTFPWENAISAFSKTVHGLDCSIEKKDSFVETLDKIIYALNTESPVIILVDAFWCSWLKYYERAHIHHHLLVKGYDKESKELICLELFVENGVQHTLPFDIYNKMYNEIYIFSKTKKTEYANPKKILQQCLLCNPNKNDDLRYFKEDILSRFDPIVENPNNDTIEAIPFVAKLDELAKLRAQYSNMLVQLYNYSKIEEVNMEFFVKGFADLSLQWNRLKYFFIKSFLSKKLTSNLFESIKNQLDFLLESESAIQREMKKIL